MGITVQGNLIVKGDQIFDGGIKVVRYGTTEEENEPLTMETLKEKVTLLRSRIENSRLWFPVCKYMMLENLCAEGDFVEATEKLKTLFPDEEFNAKDLSRLNVMSFRKPFAEWDEEDSPIKDRTTFFKYKSLGDALSEV